MRQSLFAASALLALALGATQPTAVQAQNSAFSPRVLVDGRAITHYEFDQRLRFMTLLRAPGDLVKEAENTLIDDRLRMAEAEKLKVRMTPEEIQTGMQEFAARFEMPLEQFLQIINANGVATETYRDFVHAGMLWREVVRGRFGATALAGVYEPEIDRAMSTLTQKGATRVRLSELILPAAKKVQAFELSESLKGEAAFAAAARAHSVGDTAANGGRTEFRNAATLPDPVFGALQGRTPGQITPPVRLPDGRYALYFLHQIETLDPLRPGQTAVEYARLTLGPSGSPEAQTRLSRIRANVQTCMELNSHPGALSIDTQLQSALPAEIASRLAALDENEWVIYPSGGQDVLLMLCSSRVQSSAEPSRDAIRGRLAEGQIGAEAELYLQKLRSNAFIRKP